MANPPSGMPTHASFLFARNVANVLGLMGPEGTLAPDWDDEIVAGMCVLRDGAPRWRRRGGAVGRDTRTGTQGAGS
jgi:NAD(P) transhydrogenase subunit alpha